MTLILVKFWCVFLQVFLSSVEGSGQTHSCFPLSLRSAELWNDGLHSRKNKKKDPFCPVKKKKPVVVSDILRCCSVLVSFISTHRRAVKTDVLFGFPVFSSTFITALYCLHAARPGYPWRLDCNKKGILLKAEFVTWWMCPSCDLTFQVVSVSSLPHRQWHHWGPTGWRWMVRVSPRPWLQSIPGWVWRSTRTYTPGVLTQYFVLRGDSVLF